ncbi:MAG: iron-containing alcohol dehydrogenase [Cyanobacteria bacterium REEB65]|nr:iron-containing alcohol dehydrogenase [Cyanobacteria bacterium REEB65]
MAPPRDPSLRLLTVGPGRVWAGASAVSELGATVAAAGSTAAIVTGAHSWPAARGPVLESLARAQVGASVLSYGEQVSESAVDRLCRSVGAAKSVVGVGGGKALDAAKLVAQRLGLPISCVPTSAATCAAWTALSNVYSETGGWLYGVPLDRAPGTVFADYDILLAASSRLLASGVADAMAKWYESDSAVDPAAAAATTAAALELSHYLHKQLVRHAPAAMAGDRTAAERVLDLNILLAGCVSGLGGPSCRSVAAHAVANGLTHLPGNGQSYHGEKVAFGLLTQFVLQDRPLAEIEEFVSFMIEQLRLPLDLAAQGLPNTAADLAVAVNVALAPNSTIHRLPVPVDTATLTRAILEADALARRTSCPKTQQEVKA